MGFGATGQVDRARAEPIARKLSGEITRLGYKRVGVAPRFQVQQLGKTFYVDDAGPLVDRLPEVLTQALNREARRLTTGRFEVLSSDQMLSLLGTLTDKELFDPKKLATAFEGSTAPEAIVLGRVEDITRYTRTRTTIIQGGGVQVYEEMVTGDAPLPLPDPKTFTIKCRLIDAKSGKVVAEATEDLDFTLSEGAFTGQSWELRRWVGNQLRNVGLEEKNARGETVSPFGFGGQYELAHYPLIRRENRPHPNLDAESPLKLEVTVNGSPQPMDAPNDRLFLAITPGAFYSINLKNLQPIPWLRLCTWMGLM